MQNLEAGISKQFNKHFILEEDSLRRIQGIIDKFSEGLRPIISAKTIFRVERNDDRFYETYDINDVLSDPNIEAKEIRKIIISLRYNRKVEETNQLIEVNIITLVFDTSFVSGNITHGEVTANISYHDRTWALLVIDELEPQIQKTFTSNKLSPIFPILLLVIVVSTFEFKYMHDEYTRLTSILLTPIAGLVIFLLLLLSKNAMKFFGYQSVFYWGDLKYKYNRLKASRQNIFWIIIVGFIISIASGLYLLFIQ